MVSLMYVGAYIVADRYIRRYMHLPSNLPTFARPLIYRAKIVSSSKKSRKPGCRSEDPQAFARAELSRRAFSISLFYMKIYKNCISLIFSPARNLLFSLLFATLPPGRNRHGRFPRRDLSRFRADYSSRRAANNDFARIHVVESSRLIARAPDRIASG